MQRGFLGCSQHLGLPRLPSWIVPSDVADLHNLVVSFTASHGPGDKWHPQKIIFLLGCNKSHVKCSTAYIKMAKRWWEEKKNCLFLLSNFLYIFFIEFYLSFFKLKHTRPFKTSYISKCGAYRYFHLWSILLQQQVNLCQISLKFSLILIYVKHPLLLDDHIKLFRWFSATFPVAPLPVGRLFSDSPQRPVITEAAPGLWTRDLLLLGTTLRGGTTSTRGLGGQRHSGNLFGLFIAAQSLSVCICLSHINTY